jgi:WD40 repeat protein
MFRGGKMVHGAELKMDHAFGINSSLIDNQLQIVGEDRVVFMMGNTIVVKDLKDSLEETFITKEGRFKLVTALFCYCAPGGDSPRPPLVIFLGESSITEEHFATISILETDKSKVKEINTNCRGMIKQLVVHPERSEVCALINSEQNLQVMLFNFERNRFVASCSVKFGLEKLSMHPLKEKGKQLYFMGYNSFRIWNIFYQEETIKESYESMISLTVEKEHKFSDHCWTVYNKAHTLLVVGKHLLTNKNRLLVIQNDELVHSINIEVSQTKSLPYKKDEKEDKRSIGMDFREKERPPEEAVNFKSVEFSAIAPTKKGFVVGGSKRILVMYDFEKNFGVMNSMTFLPKNLDMIEEEKIIRIHLSSSEEIINFSTINQISSMNFYIVNTYQLDAEGSFIEQFFKAGFHTKRVHTISRAITKSLLASCSEDNTVKLWNYYENDSCTKSGVLTYSFPDEPLGVSIHPCGHFLAVSFSYGFKIFAVVGEDFVMLKESQLPNCRLIKYSNSGHYLIVNEKEHIFVYDTVYYETIHLFSLGSPVQEITLSEDDLIMIATCLQGFTYCQSFLDALKTSSQKVMLFAHQEVTVYTAIAYDSTVLSDKEAELRSDLFVGATSEKYLVLYKNKCRELVAEFPVTDCTITSLLISKALKVLFAGTSSGRIRVYLWPLDESNLVWESVNKTQVRIRPPPFYEANPHSSPITALTLSHDERYLFSSAEDGTIVCLRVLEKNQDEEKKEKTGLKDEDKRRIAQTANDLYLEKIKVIQAKNETIQKYKTDVIRSEQRLKLQKEKLELMSKQNIENLKKEFNLTLESERKMKVTYIESNEKEYQALL